MFESLLQRPDSFAVSAKLWQNGANANVSIPFILHPHNPLSDIHPPILSIIEYLLKVCMQQLQCSRCTLACKIVDVASVVVVYLLACLLVKLNLTSLWHSPTVSLIGSAVEKRRLQIEARLPCSISTLSWRDDQGRGSGSGIEIEAVERVTRSSIRAARCKSRYSIVAGLNSQLPVGYLNSDDNHFLFGKGGRYLIMNINLAS